MKQQTFTGSHSLFRSLENEDVETMFGVPTPAGTRLDQQAAGRRGPKVIGQQAVVNLGAGSGVVNSVPQFSGGRRGVLHRRVGSPQILHGRPTGLSQALDVMRLQ